jgi:hypothetical protein
MLLDENNRWEKYGSRIPKNICFYVSTFPLAEQYQQECNESYINSIIFYFNYHHYQFTTWIAIFVCVLWVFVRKQSTTMEIPFILFSLLQKPTACLLTINMLTSLPSFPLLLMFLLKIVSESDWVSRQHKYKKRDTNFKRKEMKFFSNINSISTIGYQFERKTWRELHQFDREIICLNMP